MSTPHHLEDIAPSDIGYRSCLWLSYPHIPTRPECVRKGKRCAFHIQCPACLSVGVVIQKKRISGQKCIICWNCFAILFQCEDCEVLMLDMGESNRTTREGHPEYYSKLEVQLESNLKCLPSVLIPEIFDYLAEGSFYWKDGKDFQTAVYHWMCPECADTASG